MTRKAKTIFREFTPAEELRLDNLRKRLDEEKPEIIAQARAFFAAQDSARNVIAQLKAERERQGLSLADVQNRSGITRAAISTMENADSPNPTIKTIQRYARALGVTLQFSLT